MGVGKEDIAQAVKHSLRISKVKVEVEVRERKRDSGILQYGKMFKQQKQKTCKLSSIPILLYVSFICIYLYLCSCIHVFL